MTTAARLLLAFWWDDEEIESPSPRQMRKVLARAEADDEEHGGVSLDLTTRPRRKAWDATDVSETKSSSPTKSTCLDWIGGRLILTKDENALTSRHLRCDSPEEVFRVWSLLASGQLDELERLAWLDGDGDISQEEKRRLYKEAQREADREFYDSLGPERRDVRCRKPDCTRGAVELSVLCRPHHFRSVKGRKCPFSD